MTKFLNNADIKGYIAQTAVTSYLLKADSTGRLVAAIAGTDYQAPTTALLPSGGTAGQILAKIDGTNYNTQWIDNYTPQVKHDVKLGAALSKGTPVYVSNANGTNMIVSAASNASEATSSKTLGLLESGGVLNDTVKVVTEGLLAGLDTSTALAGDPVWLGPSGTLLYGLANKPVAPVHMVFIGIVTRVQSVNGEIFVKVQNGFELDELHNVALSSVADGQGLFYESATNLWKNKTIAAVLGYTPANGANYLPLSGGTLTGALSGTSATFSGDLTSLSATINGTTNAYLNLNAANAGGNEAGVYFKVGGVAKWEQYTAANDGNLSFWSNGNGIRFYITPTGGGVFTGNISASNFRVYNGSTTGGYLIPKAGWVGSGTDYSPSIAAETTYGINFFTNGSASVKMYLATTGQLQLNTYTSSTSYTGTAAGYLAFDSSGNVITVAGVAATDNTKLPLAGGTMTGILAFSNVTGNKIDFYHTTTGSGDRYGVQVQNSELRIHSGAGGDAAGGITFGKSTTTTFTEAMRVRNDGNVLLANAGTLILGIDDTMDRTVVGGASRTRLQLAPPSHTGAEWTFVTYDDSSNAYIRIGYGNGSSSFQMRHDGYTTIAGNVLLHAGNYNSYSPTLTGGGASGTWGINVTGNANNITQYVINQNLSTGADVTHAILRASSYVVTPLIYSGGGNVVFGNNLQVGSGLSTNSTYDANFFGRFTPDGKYLTRNWQLNDGGYTWSSLNYTQISDSPIGSYTMRGNNNSYTAQRQSGWVAIDRTKTYKVSVWYRTISGSPLVYLSFTQAGWDLSQPDNGGWGQPYFAVVNTSSTTWQEFTMTIGPSGSGAGYTWYSYARYAQLGVLMNYNNSGNAEITGFKMEEVDSTLANNTTVLGDSLYVGTSTSSNIYMTDSDESTRRIHCNSGRIGFLNSSNGWGAYCDNSGNWTSDSSLRAPIFYDSNDTSYYLDPNSTGTSLNVAGTVRGSYYVASNYSSTGYTQYKGYDNNNHFIMVRGRVTGNTTSPTYTGYHRTSLVEYAEANDDTGWFFQTAATGNYDIVARITRSYSQFEGSVRAPIFYDSNDTGYYGDFASTSRMNAIVYNDLKWAGDQSYGFLGRNVYADTINGRGSDPLELNYYDGGDVRIGTGVNGSKGLYAGALYDAGSRVAISRGEGRNYVDYSRYVYNNGAYSGSGWVEPSDLGVRYANSAGSATSASYARYFQTNYVGGQQTNPQVYFNYSQGLNVAMTGAWSVWSDTLWINGYSGGDVPWMCALHFLRNSEPRLAISAQTRDSSGYGTYYEILSTYNASYAKNMNQNVRTSDDVSFQFITGARRVMGEYLYSNGWVYSSGGNTGWLQDNQNQGIRAAGYNSYFGTIATYGNNSNGYGGYTIMNNYRVILMQNSSGDFGFYNNDDWKWNLFYNRGNDCWGIGTDNTYSGDGFRCIKYGSAQYGWTTWSDRRAKENISTITGALDKVLNMRGVYFNYIIDEEKTKRVGFIAQELQEILPEAVRYAEEIDEYNVEYGQIVSVLTEAIKEQNIKIQSLEAQLQTLLN